MIINNIEILYIDNEITVINKPGGLLAVPGRGPGKKDCVVTRLQNHFREMIPQPAVHRLDMFTSGLMVFAITRDAHRGLSMQFEKRRVHKTYEAVVEGRISGETGELRLPFRLDPDNRPLQIYDPENGKTGITAWKKIAQGTKTCRLEFTPLTGRTHQLRVHAAHPKGLNAPIVGDSLYGSGKEGDRMYLHATSLQFSHPKTGNRMQLFSTPPF